MNACKRASEAPIFHLEYERLCILQGTCPLAHVTVNLKENVLDINVDKIRADEWCPIFNALKVNNSLKRIMMRSSLSFTNIDEKRRKLIKRRIPSIRSREMMIKLFNSIRDCLCVSQSIDCLILQNLPVNERHMKQLAKGISKSASLKYLSMEKCCLGDTCFEAIVMSIKTSLSLLSIDFSCCNLSWKSAELIAEIIKYQASQRYNEAWQGSLRYRRPELDKMHGLRRITLCNNRISDNGARILADAVKDDLWLKAIDLQQCNISGDGAEIMKESLLFNRSLWVLDLRRNQQIAYDLLRSIIELVMINAGGEHPEYPWISNEETYNQFKKQSKNTSVSFRKNSSLNKGTNKKRGKMDFTSRLNHSSRKMEDQVKMNRCTKHPVSSARLNNTDLKSTKRSPLKNSIKKVGGKCNSSIDAEVDECFDGKGHLDRVKKLQFDIEFYKLQLDKEKKLRYSLNNKVIDLENRNKKLHEELDGLKSTKGEKSIALEFPSIQKSDLDDEKILEGIEASFERFQQFLDMLEGMGLGNLYSQLQPEERELPDGVGNINEFSFPK